MKLINHSCRWCGDEKYNIIVKGPDLLTGFPGEFQHVQCSNCGLIRQNPYLEWDHLKEYYPDDYNSYQPQASEISSTIRRLDKRYGLLKRVKLVYRYQPSGRWVDIGAGTGRILQEAMLWDKWELMGIEPVKKAADYITSRTGLPVFANRLEEFTGNNDHFDIVTMWDVLEHFVDPIEILKKINQILKPKGVLIFSIPNLRSLDRKLFKNYWVGYDLPRHLHLFPDDLLNQILNQLGFKVIKKKCIAGSHGALMLNLAFLNKKIDAKLLTRLLSLGSDSIIPRIFTFIPLYIMDQLKLGSNITYVVMKL